MDVVALRVRDRFLIEAALDTHYRGRRLAASTPPRAAVRALVEGAWETRVASDRVAWAGITRAVSRLMDVFKHAPGAWLAIKHGLGIEGDSTLGIAARIKDLMTEGKAVLGKVLHHATQTFPLSLFFIDRGKVPGLTALMAYLAHKVPWLHKALEKVHAGADVVDVWFKKYLPTLRRPIYAAIFIYVWLSVFEISWDVKDLIAGFTGSVTLHELLSSLPESALGALISSLGLGTFAALPVTLIIRLMWLTAHRYLEYKPGHGFTVRWDRLGYHQLPEHAPQHVPA